MLDNVYEKTMTFHEIEEKLLNNYKLYGIDYQVLKIYLKVTCLH